MANDIMVVARQKRPLSGAAAAFVEAKTAAGRAAFSLSELTEETGLSITAARNQLRRLGSRVVRPTWKHQFFLIVAPEHQAMGTPPATWWLDDYFKWLGRPYYLALQSAAATYGSAPQALQVTQVMTDEPRREITVGRVRVSFFVKSDIGKTPTQPMANAYAPLNVSTPEATAFDLVRYAPRIGGIGRAAETLSPLLTLMRIAELKQLLEAENETSTAQRLGYILEKRGKEKLAAAVYAWLPSRLPLIPLVPTKSKSGHAPVIEKWRLKNNSAEADL